MILDRVITLPVPDCVTKTETHGFVRKADLEKALIVDGETGVVMVDPSVLDQASKQVTRGLGGVTPKPGFRHRQQTVSGE
jgi:hypothetical protein